MEYETFLLDIDNTLFDFDACERLAFEKACKFFGIEITDKFYNRYSAINDKLWKLLEKGGIKKDVLKVERFRLLFEEFCLSVPPALVNEKYTSFLAETCVLFPETKTVLQKLKSLGKRLYVITNGTKHVQLKRIELSGVKDYFDGVFISDEIGYEKPSIHFFCYVEKTIKDFDKQTCLIVGDSLSSDIMLGVNSGVDTCYFNPKRNKDFGGVSPTYEIRNLSEILNYA